MHFLNLEWPFKVGKQFQSKVELKAGTHKFQLSEPQPEVWLILQHWVPFDLQILLSIYNVDWRTMEFSNLSSWTGIQLKYFQILEETSWRTSNMTFDGHSSFSGMIRYIKQKIDFYEHLKMFPFLVFIYKLGMLSINLTNYQSYTANKKVITSKYISLLLRHYSYQIPYCFKTIDIKNFLIFENFEWFV